ncbi:hypothetical protein M1146_04995 [Patescibacteria group bacterium]|nr:hypothetical protein [Patescibacteria group bacterium]
MKVQVERRLPKFLVSNTINFYYLGAEWTAAPKPLMRDSLYPPYPPHEPFEARWKEMMNGNLGLSEEEPVWDAADFLRMGKSLSFNFAAIIHSYVAF